MVKKDRRCNKMTSKMAMACLALVTAAVMLGCGPRIPESKLVTIDNLKPVLKEAIADYMEESRKKSIETVIERSKSLIDKEIERLNTAEKLYNSDQVRTIILPGPLTYGWYLKQYRDYYQGSIADIVEDKSALVAYNVYIKYDYRLQETKRHHNTFEEDSRVNAQLETEFHPTDHKGYLVLSYGFNNHLKYNGLPPAVITSKKARDEIGRAMPGVAQEMKFNAQWVSSGAAKR